MPASRSVQRAFTSSPLPASPTSAYLGVRQHNGRRHGMHIPAFLSFAQGLTGVDPPSWAYILRDDFCPYVTITRARSNRKRRLTLRRNKRFPPADIPPTSSQVVIPRAIRGPRIYSLSQEHVDFLKASYPDRSYYGGPDYTCSHCNAFFWFRERVVSRSSVAEHRIIYNKCCRGGRVVLPSHRQFPEPLNSLVSFNGGAASNTFMRHIRQYNSLFSFTSMGVQVDNSINTGNGPYVFRINGVVHHKIGSLLPQEGTKPQFAQLYIYDTENEVRNRLNLFGDELSQSLDPRIVDALMNMLDNYNPLVKKFRMARDRLMSPDAPEISIKLSGSVGVTRDVYSLPTAPELAALIVGDITVEQHTFDVIVEARSSELRRISPVHPALMSLQYPLLFPYGDAGYHKEIELNLTEEDNMGGRKYVSMNEYYTYYEHYRPNHPNPLLCSGRLSQQFIVNAYSCVESNRLSFYYHNQSRLRTATYQGISDAVDKGASLGKEVGVKTILPVSHIGGQRYLKANYHDCMAICCVYGPPDIFTTMTCNTSWPEIREALTYEPGQKPCDRADIVVRVFHMKLHEYLEDIKDGRIYGPVCAVAYTNEFQKRGLPHSHILVWQKGRDHQPCAEEVDFYISAELPDPAVDPLGFALVSEFMMHGPCGNSNPNSPCMKDGKCSKKYPKPFRPETSFDADGYPLYRRRDSGIIVRKNGVDLDNRFVVPHNLYSLKKYQCHINSEACNKTYLIKYLFKYINKGFDRAKFSFKKVDGTANASVHTTSDMTVQDGDGIDEIAEYIRSRYLSVCESSFRSMGFEIHGKFPAVQRLCVHLPGQNLVTVHEEADLEDVVDNDDSQKSMLTEWFAANKRSSLGHDLTYCQFPTRFRWDSDKKMWLRRTKGFKLGRVLYVHPGAGEAFYLRMLLMVVCGATCYEDLKTYEGKLYATFKEACQARGLMGDDLEWVSLFDEVVQWATAHQIRNLFMTVVAFCEVGNVRSLFDKFWRYMADDIVYRLQAGLPASSNRIPDTVLQPALIQQLTDMFSSNGLSITSYDLPSFSSSAITDSANRLITEELSYNIDELRLESVKMMAALNNDQRKIFHLVVQGIHSRKPFVYFVSGHGGTGKTFLWNTILSALRAEGRIVLAVASCGVASLLMTGGRTAHSRFKIPLDINERSQCSIPRGTQLAALLKRTSLIIWDEAPMTHRHCFEALERTLRDILSVDCEENAFIPFGGMPILFGGDFRQVLPVIPGASRKEIIDASLLGSYIWKHVHVLRLSKNMRVDNPLLSMTERKEMEVFAQWVLNIGEGKAGQDMWSDDTDGSVISVPEEFILKPSGPKIPAIVDAVYNDFSNMYSSIPYLANRSIVCPTNSVVDEINTYMVDNVPGPARDYHSFDKIANSSEQPADFQFLYPPEFLNSISINNFSQHRLSLKVGVPVVLLRNINQASGLCNGTRLILERLGDHVLEACVITGNHAGELVAIPRIVLNGTNPKWPFTLQRRQFPIRVSYAMTINKCQGQTLTTVGVYLREPVFTHGQLYVAVSRVTNKQGLVMLIEGDNGNPCSKTRNIVYDEVLRYV